tara:strand:- start:327 stop:503 length:177 start_codon:yes stop_codon:yes gene_type:complete
MKVKLKKGEKLSSNMNYCGLEYYNWIALNQGKTVDMDAIPNKIKNKVQEIATAKQGDK